MRAVTAADVARHLTMTVTGRTNHADLLSRLSRNGSVTVAASSPPLQTSRPVSYHDTVYDVSRETTDQSSATAYTVALTRPPETATNGSIRFSALPAVDRRKLARAGLGGGEPLGVATRLEYTDDERGRSELVPTPTHPVIGWESGRRAGIDVRDPTPITVYTYEYTATETGSVTAYGADVLDQYGFTLTGLSSGEERILRQAIDGANGFVVDRGRPLSAAFRSLVRQFDSERPVRQIGASRVSGEYLVEYRNDTYWTKLVVRQAARDRSNDG
ncbi:MAG: hypothetical protein ABEJ28_00645 [Salinigranum sp.]